MQQISYQTVKLGRGRHSSPTQGACVMELASMLAGEPFSDHPRSVSRSIASFLRAYNDMLDDKHRQDLYAFAAKSVGTAAPHGVEVFRAARLVAWGDEQCRRRSHWPLAFRSRRRAARRLQSPEDAAQYAARAIRRPTEEIHQSVLTLIDELIAIGSERGAWTTGEAWRSEAAERARGEVGRAL